MASLDDIKKLLDEKLAELASDKAPKPRKPLVLAKKGNQAQADHAQEVLSALDQAESALEQQKIDAALDHVSAAKKLVGKRLKLIRIADKSPNGWGTVLEYETDELASNSEDEKRLKKAEAEASKKRKAKSEESRNVRARFAAASTSRNSSSIPDREPSSRPFFRGGSSARRSFRYEDKCYSCGKVGHWRVHCPRGQTSTNVKGELSDQPRH